MVKRTALAAAFCAAFIADPGPTRAQTVDTGMATAAAAWLDTLGDRRHDGAFPFDDGERTDWHYIPGHRSGIRFGDMTDAQRRASLTLMRSTLSTEGVLKAEAIMALEAVLAEVEGSSLSYRDPEKYFISVFGTPGDHPWGWRLEGHHLSINVTAAAPGSVSVTPTFLGTNPARIPGGPREGERVQRDEYVLALRLARSLDPAQREQVLLRGRSLGNIVAGPNRGDALEAPEGLAVSALTADQQVLLTDLIRTYVGMARDEIGRPYMDHVHAGWGETRLAWAGPTTGNAPFYYRIHGPRLLIEFDNTQDGGNHIHSLWRDPANDFGRDDLRRHYRDAPRGHGHNHSHRP